MADVTGIFVTIKSCWLSNQDSNSGNVSWIQPLHSPAELRLEPLTPGISPSPRCDICPRLLLPRMSGPSVSCGQTFSTTYMFGFLLKALLRSFRTLCTSTSTSSSDCAIIGTFFAFFFFFFCDQAGWRSLGTLLPPSVQTESCRHFGHVFLSPRRNHNRTKQSSKNSM